MSNTKSKNHLKIWLGIAVLLLAGLACSVGSSVETTPPPAQASAPTSVPAQQDGGQPVDTPVQSGGQGLTSAQRQKLALATVLIIMTKDEGGRLVPFGIGSGTIISPDGLILTNAHVASPAAQGFPQDEPDALVIALNEREDRPPVPTYIAELRAVDGFLDLAVIQITATLDGARVNPSSLNFDYVEIGDSDQLHLGDTINIFGFPGIGGDTITFTSGNVSGFSSQEAIGDRAWIKTDATIAGGNSGGLGANDLGQIIGVPTRGGAGGDTSIADCRVVQDTNGDGRLDQNDTCIPIGGFINALRPINLAKPLIRAAQTGVAYESPYQAGAAGGAAGTGAERFNLVAWSEEFTDEGCPVAPVQSFPSGVTQISAVFDFTGMTDGQPFAMYWLLDGEVVVQEQFAWDGGSNDNCFAFFIHNGGEALPDGEYTILLYAGEELPLIAEATTFVGGAAGQPVTAGGAVQVSGQILDADTGKGIPGAVIVILNPGVDIDAWLDNGTDADIYVYAEADANGFFSLSRPLERGIEYPGIAGKEGYQPTRGFLLFEAGDPDQINLTLELTR